MQKRPQPPRDQPLARMRPDLVDVWNHRSGFIKSKQLTKYEQNQTCDRFLTAVEGPGSALQHLEGERRHHVGLPRDDARPLHGLGADRRD